jgi:S-disulfanyl-L-cysteine oxidoreductase SoxD
MCSYLDVTRRAVVTVLVLASGWCLAAPPAAPPAALPTAAYPGIGRTATPQELAAWDTDVRADFKGLPPGRGNVLRGQELWEAKCASCHGVFGESNEVFTPLIGGTTAADIQTGRVARLTDPAYPGRTTLMKLPTLSTLWDYIYRAMPWNAPKSLTPDDVYAVTAFMLNLGGVVPDDFTLSQENMAATQARLPNRNGMTTAHGLWPEDKQRPLLGNGGKPDVQARACMSGCAPTAQPLQSRVQSKLPDFARNAHGNLADQNRLVGPQRGVNTATATATATATPASTGPTSQKLPQQLAQRHNCLACHGVNQALVGPSLAAVAQKYANRSDAASYLAARIQAGSAGVWGAIAMPAQTLPAADAQAIAQWIASGMPAQKN